jgi:hypothetical protein
LLRYSLAALDAAGPTELSDALERGRVIYFPECPITLPGAEDQAFLREELPRSLKRKNVSYYPDARRLSGLKADGEARERVRGLLSAHGERVRDFLHERMPGFTRYWRVGTTSFRPLQERGRNLSAHASNELVHVDAGAYGATHGARILRFFVNLNVTEDRVWATKGTFGELYARYGEASGVRQAAEGGVAAMRPGFFDTVRTRTLRGLERAGVPMARVLDSSPYDRLMRRFHNFMKDTPAVQAAREGHQELSFAPFSAWMVLTDGVSHACLSGQHALVDTFLIPLESCRLPEASPWGILGGARSAA